MAGKVFIILGMRHRVINVMLKIIKFMLLAVLFTVIYMAVLREVKNILIQNQNMKVLQEMKYGLPVVL